MLFGYAAFVHDGEYHCECAYVSSLQDSFLYIWELIENEEKEKVMRRKTLTKVMSFLMATAMLCGEVGMTSVAAYATEPEVDEQYETAAAAESEEIVSSVEVEETETAVVPTVEAVTVEESEDAVTVEETEEATVETTEEATEETTEEATEVALYESSLKYVATEEDLAHVTLYVCAEDITEADVVGENAEDIAWTDWMTVENKDAKYSNYIRIVANDNYALAGSEAVSEDELYKDLGIYVNGSFEGIVPVEDTVTDVYKLVVPKMVVAEGEQVADSVYQINVKTLPIEYTIAVGECPEDMTIAFASAIENNVAADEITSANVEGEVYAVVSVKKDEELNEAEESDVLPAAEEIAEAIASLEIKTANGSVVLDKPVYATKDSVIYKIAGVGEVTEDITVNVIKNENIELQENLNIQCTIAGATAANDYTIAVPIGVDKSFKYTITGADKAKADPSKISFVWAKPSSYSQVSTDTTAKTANIKLKPNFINYIKSYPDSVKLLVKYDSQVIAEFKAIPETTSISKITPIATVAYTTDTMIALNVSVPATYPKDADSLAYLVTATAVKDKNGNVAAGMKESVYAYRKVDSMSDGENLVLSVCSGLEGSGKAQKYNIDVYIIQTDGSIYNHSSSPAFDKIENWVNYGKILNDGTTAAIGKVKKLSGSTQNPYYDTKLTFKKIAKKIYQGEENVLYGQVTNSKTATYRGRFEVVKVETIYKKKVINTNPSNVKIDATEFYNTGKVIVSARNGTSVPFSEKEGVSYKVTYKAYNELTMQPTYGTFDIKLAQGIGLIFVNPDNWRNGLTRLYKAENAAASLKLNVYMWDYSNYTIKATAKNVKYEIVDANGYGIDSGSMNAHIKQAVLDGKIKAANGKVTIDKKYVISGPDTDNQFQVRVTAADYDHGSYSVSRDSGIIQINGATNKIAEIRCVKFDSVGGKITTIPDTQVGAPTNKGVVRLNDSNKYASGYLVALDSNGNIVKDVDFETTSKYLNMTEFIDGDGNNYAYFQTDNVSSGNYVITVKTIDGTKSSGKFQFKCTADPYYIYSSEDATGATLSEVVDGNTVKVVNKYVAPVTLKLETRNSGKYLMDAVPVSGGKIISKKVVKGVHYYTIMPSAEKTLIKVSAPNLIGGYFNYEITNEMYTSTTATTASSIDNVSWYTSTKVEKKQATIYQGCHNTQKLKINLSNYSYAAGDKLIVRNTADDYIKTTPSRRSFNSILIHTETYEDANPYRYGGAYIDSDKSATLSIDSFEDYLVDNNVKPGKYKLLAQVVTSSDVPKSLPFEIEIKVENIPKTVGKLSATGTVTATAGSVVNLPITGANTNIESFMYSNILDSNVKGVPSGFTRYFEISGNKLVLKASHPEIPANKKITGWVYYSYVTPAGAVTESKLVTISFK